jgi:hypothetical protein
MNMTPAPEDLLTGDDYDSQLFRNQLLPLWMKIVSYLFVFGAVALAAIFIIFQVEENWSAILDAFHWWEDMLVLLLLLNFCLFGLTAWGLLREKRWAAGFGPVNIAIGVLAVAYAVAEAIWARFKYPAHRQGLDELVIFVVFILLCIYLYRLLTIRKEWKLRRSQITGDF